MGLTIQPCRLLIKMLWIMPLSEELESVFDSISERPAQPLRSQEKGLKKSMIYWKRYNRVKTKLNQDAGRSS